MDWTEKYCKKNEGCDYNPAHLVYSREEKDAIWVVIGSFIGVFIGFGIYKFWHFKTYPNLYAMQSAPWYTELLLDGALVAVLVVVCIILKLIIWRKLKP